jgi:NADP-dependent aldehyde dehydrogenase
MSAIAGRAADAHTELRRRPAAHHAELLRAIAAQIEAAGKEIVASAEEETALPRAGLEGELTRTLRQLEMFAALAAEGSYVEPVIDHADPASVPPRPDLRRMLVGIGPVAVFGASNFPLAFGVAGGDTASALAAGCPVVCRAHPLHPRTARLTADRVTEGIRAAGGPLGTFALAEGPGLEIGRVLVTEAAIQAEAFTGSLAGGRALYDLAAARPQPIPVFAEMGSVNPFIVLPGALAERAGDIVTGLSASLTTGVGQLCTSPGVVFVPEGEAGDDFTRALTAAVSAVPARPMLSQAMADRHLTDLTEMAALPGARLLAGDTTAGPQGGRDGVVAAILSVGIDLFASAPVLREEHFGPLAVVVRYGDPGDLTRLLRLLPAGLTITVHTSPADGPGPDGLTDTAVQRAGRIIWNGYPTGVAVTWAMTHGGPYPATTAPAHTAVGPAAVRRFLRPVTFQNAPESALPAALHDDNPLRLRRLVDGVPG